jgi:hypothetical protein
MTMLTVAALALLLTLPTNQPERVEPPMVKFAGATKSGMLSFELSNPKTDVLPYLGFTPNSFSGGLEKGTIAPLYDIQLLRGKEWTPYPIGWCGFGLGSVSLPRKGKATFRVGLPRGTWDKFRVGVTWFKTAGRKEWAIAWSETISKDDLTTKRP